jgi:hypothetical protein
VRKLLFKSTLLALPFLVATGLEAFVLPVDSFTFRLWEALRIDTFGELLPGVFYPRMDVTTVEEGDLGHHSVNAVKKLVRWQTDRYGFRKADSDRTAWPVVIVGDSIAAGSSLTQRELLSEVLGGTLGVDVYPLAPADMNGFLRDERFTAHPPKIVVVECVERTIPGCLPEVRDTMTERPRSSRPINEWVRRVGVIQRIGVPLDRIWKGTLRNNARASVERKLARVTGTRAPQRGGPKEMLFLSPVNTPIPEADRNTTVARLTGYQRILGRRGIRLVFLPIPEKQNIHHRQLPGAERPRSLARLIAALRDAGVETVDTQAALDDAYQRDGVPLYHTDDSHLNGRGIRVVADQVAQMIGPPGTSSPSPRR